MMKNAFPDGTKYAAGVLVGLGIFAGYHLWTDHESFHTQEKKVDAIIVALSSRGSGSMPTLPTPATIEQTTTTTTSTTSTTVKK